MKVGIASDSVPAKLCQVKVGLADKRANGVHHLPRASIPHLRVLEVCPMLDLDLKLQGLAIGDDKVMQMHVAFIVPALLMNEFNELLFKFLKLLSGGGGFKGELECFLHVPRAPNVADLVVGQHRVVDVGEASASALQRRQGQVNVLHAEALPVDADDVPDIKGMRDDDKDDPGEHGRDLLREQKVGRNQARAQDGDGLEEGGHEHGDADVEEDDDEEDEEHPLQAVNDAAVADEGRLQQLAFRVCFDDAGLQFLAREFAIGVAVQELHEAAGLPLEGCLQVFDCQVIAITGNRKTVEDGSS